MQGRVKIMRTPQPRDTNLARFVKKILDYIPGYTVGKKLDLERKLYNLHIEIEHQYAKLEHLQDMYYKLTESPNLPPPGVSVENFIEREQKRIALEFKPIQYSFITRNEKSIQMSAEVEYMLREAAYHLSQEHVRELESKIFEITKQKLNLVK